jgi:catechol 2,3-dioxygenase-like lactoylglutathione lyase family enzyme
MQTISAVALVVHDYDEAIHFFTHCLRFAVVQDAAISPSKRWVMVRPPRGGTGRRPDRGAGVPVPPDGRLLAGLPRHAGAWRAIYGRAEGGGVRHGRRLPRPIRQQVGSGATPAHRINHGWRMTPIRHRASLASVVVGKGPKDLREEDVPWVNRAQARRHHAGFARRPIKTVVSNSVGSSQWCP